MNQGRRNRRLRCSVVLCLLCLLVSSSLLARVERFAVLVGNNRGDAGEPDLQYAEQDAIKVFRVLEQLGEFGPENMSLLNGSNSARVRRAIIATNDRVRALADRGIETVLLVYYSGHGDDETLHMNGTHLLLKEIEQLVRGSAATTRLLLIDACRSGALTQVKGGSPVLPFAIDVDNHLVSQGVVFLTSATLGESAQESSEIQGSFFTHHLVSGLRGAADSNGDNRIVLDEAYRHAYHYTLRDSSRTLAGAQHPTYHYDLRGRGDLVLTRLRGAAPQLATLQLPEGYDFYVLVDDPQGAVVAEVTSSAKGRSIVLTPGRYFVRGRGQRQLLEGVVELQANQQRNLSSQELARSEYARLARKGDAQVVLSPAWEAGYWGRTALWPAGQGCHGVYTSTRLAMRYLTLSPTLRACRGGFKNDTVRARANELTLDVRAAYVFDLPYVSVDIAALLGASLLQQAFATSGEAPDRNTAALLFGVGSALTFELPWHSYLAASLEARSYLYPEWRAPDQTALATPIVLAGSLGLGKRF